MSSETIRLKVLGDDARIRLKGNDNSSGHMSGDTWILSNVMWENIVGKPSVYPPAEHTHPQYLTEELDPTVPAWAKEANKPEYTAAEVGALPASTFIPTKTSELTNDSGFLTEHQSLEDYATKNWVEGKGYLTEHQSLAGYATEAWVQNQKYLVDADLEGLASEDWVQNQGYLTEHQSLSGYAKESWVNSQGFLKTAPVTSVNQKTGDVVLTGADINYSDTDNTTVKDAFDRAALLLDDAYTLALSNNASIAELQGNKQDRVTASGILKGDGNGGVSAAVAGTDYQAPIPANTYDAYGAAASAVSTHNSNASAHSSLFAAKQDVLTAGDNIDITNDVISVDGIVPNAALANGIPYGQVDSTSTATEYTATVPGITELKDGVCVLLKNGVVTSASGFTINVNGLGAKPSYSNLAAATRDTTIFNINYTMLFVYDENRVSGGCWICYRGYDANTNTIGYQLRTNNSTLKAADKGYKYRLWFTSADGSKWVPANKSTSTDATTSRTPNTTPINPFGPIVYNSTNGTVNANASLPAATLWQQYTLTIGYSFNEPGGSMTYPAPVYLKCTPQTNGSAVMVELVQALPSTNDGYIYILLGRAYSATAMELTIEHPVFYHDGTAIRLWTGAASSGGGVTSVNGQTGAVTLSIPSTAADVNALANTGGDVEGDVTLKAPAATNSPCLIFQRGTLTDNYNDWMIQDRGGYLYFDERGQGSSAWTNRVMFNTTGGVVATSFSGSGASLTGVVKPADIANMQTTGNLVTSVSASSTDSQYPSAKCVYDLIGNVETLLAAI